MDLDILMSVVCEDAERHTMLSAENSGISSDQCLKRNVTWSSWEDQTLIDAVNEHGAKKWAKNIAKYLPNRVGKQCRERWHNHLDPNVRKGPFTPEETRILFDAWTKFPHQWSKLATMLPGRTDNAVKNQWHNLQSQTARRAHGGEDVPIIAGDEAHPVVLTQDSPQSTPAPQRTCAAMVVSLQAVTEKLEASGMEQEAIKLRAWQAALGSGNVADIDLQKAALDAQALAAKLRQRPTSGRGCKCKKSRCLKKYCECFAAEVYCDGCGCSGCANSIGHPEDDRYLQPANAQPSGEVSSSKLTADAAGRERPAADYQGATLGEIEQPLVASAATQPTKARQLAASVLLPTLRQLAEKLQFAGMLQDATKVRAWTAALENDRAGDVDLQRAALDAQTLAAKLGAKAKTERIAREQSQSLKTGDRHAGEGLDDQNANVCVLEKIDQLKIKWRRQRTHSSGHKQTDSITSCGGNSELPKRRKAKSLGSIAGAFYDLSDFVSENSEFGYLGVCWDAQKSQYYAQITLNDEEVFLGLYETVEEAATVWARKHVEVYGAATAHTESVQRVRKRARDETDLCSSVHESRGEQSAAQQQSDNDWQPEEEDRGAKRPKSALLSPSKSCSSPCTEYCGGLAIESKYNSSGGSDHRNMAA